MSSLISKIWISPCWQFFPGEKSHWDWTDRGMQWRWTIWWEGQVCEDKKVFGGDKKKGEQALQRLPTPWLPSPGQWGVHKPEWTWYTGKPPTWYQLDTLVSLATNTMTPISTRLVLLVLKVMLRQGWTLFSWKNTSLKIRLALSRRHLRPRKSLETLIARRHHNQSM